MSKDHRETKQFLITFIHIEHIDGWRQNGTEQAEFTAFINKQKHRDVMNNKSFTYIVYYIFYKDDDRSHTHALNNKSTLNKNRNMNKVDIKCV